MRIELWPVLSHRAGDLQPEAYEHRYPSERFFTPCGNHIYRSGGIWRKKKGM